MSPAGEIQRCSESPVACGYREWHPGLFGPTGCRGCWTSCRGECQAPIDWERIRQVARVYSGRPRASAGAARAADPVAAAR